MLLKLILGFRDDLAFEAAGGSVVRWHKREGDKVNYGDDLLDFKIEEFAVSSEAWELCQRTVALNLRPAEMARSAEEHFQSGDLRPDSIRSEGPKSHSEGACYVRVSSSDSGVLQHICVGEGERCQAGDLLAAFATEDANGAIGTEDGLVQAGIFRVVANPLPIETYPTQPLKHRIENKGVHRQVVTDNSITFWSERPDEKRVGIYLKGGRYLNAVFACAPLIRPVLRGMCCILRENKINLRSDLLLQARHGLPRDWVVPFAQTLDIEPDDFQSDFYDSTFLAPGEGGPTEFPKTVVVLSIVPDVLLTSYQHRELGFQVDFGNRIPHYIIEALAGGPVRKLESIHEHFICTGKMTADKFFTSFAKVVQVLKLDTRAHVLVFNTPSITSGDQAHNYQFMDEPPTRRRLEFNLALAELSRKLDFPIVDVDRILKRSGIWTQVNWDILHPKLHLDVAREVFGLMNELGVFSGNSLRVGVALP